MSLDTDDAPLRTRRADKGDADGGLTHVGRTVLINRPRQELFAYWRDFTNLATFMENVESIEMSGPDRARWRIKAPLGQTVEIETEVTESVDGEIIGWRSTADSQIETEGRVTFTDAGGGRGTAVAADIAYRPPGGPIGQTIAKLFMREPDIQARQELKRFKMLMEAGEIARGPDQLKQQD